MINVFGWPLRAPSHLTRLILLSALSVALMILDHRGHHLEKIRAGLNVLAYPVQLIASVPAYVIVGLFTQVSRVNAVWLLFGALNVP